MRSAMKLGRPLAWANWRPVILARLDLHPGMTVLDAGCGSGRLTVPAAKRVGETGRVVAVDLRAGRLRRAIARARRARLANVNFIDAGIADAKLEANEFDRALLVAVLGDTLERTATLKAVFKALKPGGVLAVTEHVFDPHFQDRNTVARLGEIAGFRVRDLHGTPLAYTMRLEKPSPREAQRTPPRERPEDRATPARTEAPKRQASSEKRPGSQSGMRASS